MTKYVILNGIFIIIGTTELAERKRRRKKLRRLGTPRMEGGLKLFFLIRSVAPLLACFPSASPLIGGPGAIRREVNPGRKEGLMGDAGAIIMGDTERTPEIKQNCQLSK